MGQESQGKSNLITVLGAVAVIIAAIIGLGLPFAERLADRYLPTFTPIPISSNTPIPPQVIVITETSAPVNIVQPQSIDLTCQGRETNATINGALVPLSSWQADCSYYKVLNGENFTLSTWGVILIYNSSITGSVIVQPNTSYVAPNNSVLFAGYINKESLLRAYEARNPNAPTPSP